MWARKVQGLHAWEMDVHRFSLYNVVRSLGNLEIFTSN